MIMKRKIRMFGRLLTALGISAFLLAGCDKSPTAPGSGQKSDVVKSAAAQSVEFYNTFSSVSEVNDMMRGPDAKVDLGTANIKKPDQAMTLMRQTKKDVLAAFRTHAPNPIKMRSVQGESLVWEFTQRNTAEGYTSTVRFLYDSDTGYGRLQEIKFDFDARHHAQYDSSEVYANLNFTLEDDSDDVIKSLVNIKQYKPDNLPDNFALDEEVRIELDDYPAGTEPASGNVTATVKYVEGNFITESVQKVQFSPDAGEWTKDVSYADGKSSHEKVTFKSDGTGTFEETRRDGTRVEGTFDDAEQDGKGSFAQTTTFPPGSDPVSIYEAGEFTINQADSTLHGSFEKEIRLKNGDVQKESVTVDESIQNGFKTTVVAVQQSDGSGGTITMEENADGQHVTGEWEDADGTFTKLDANYYKDGSAHLEFWVYTSKKAYDNGEDPVAHGIMNFGPDGSGSGKISAEGEEHPVEIAPNGSQSIG